METIKNEIKLKPTDFIPLMGYFTYPVRCGEANAEATINKDIPHEGFEYNSKNIGWLLYHSAFILGITFSPLIYQGLENLMK